MLLQLLRSCFISYYVVDSVLKESWIWLLQATYYNARKNLGISLSSCGDLKIDCAIVWYQKRYISYDRTIKFILPDSQDRGTFFFFGSKTYKIYEVQFSRTPSWFSCSITWPSTAFRTFRERIDDKIGTEFYVCPALSFIYRVGISFGILYENYDILLIP